MSAKWRALQHRHRYTYTTVIFPPPFLLALSHSNNNDNNIPLLNDFYSKLNQLANLTSTYAQLNHVKNVSSSFNNLLLGSTDEGSIRLPVKLYLELLFLDNSLPLHRTLLSVLTKNRKFWDLLAGCFRSLCDEYGGGVGKRFCVSRVALSMMSTPKLGYLVDVIEECCVLVALDVVYGLRVVVEETNGWARPSPLVMEQCQEGLSCLYYLLQRFPPKFVGDESELVCKEDSSLMEMVVAVIVCVLKSASFSRDCFVAAGVSFCAALQVLLSTQELGFLIWEGVFEQKRRCYIGSSDNEYENAVAKVPYKGDFSFEIRSFPPLSRLCLIRGILTAVPRTVLNAHFVGGEDGLNAESKMQSILYNAILPELCKYCENPTDSHFNFHALTVMQICLQQIKTSLLAESVDWSADFSPIPEDLGARIVRIIWNNLEDPLSQTVKQVHLIFDLFLDIKAALHRGDDGVVMKSFLQKIAGDLLRLGSRCKGRYIPLASLTRRLGAKNVLGMSPNLLFETMHAYIDDDVCCAATSFLKCLLECLRDECWSSDGVERGYEMYRSLCLPPFLLGLASGVSKLRSNLNTYALTSLLDVDVDSIFTMLSFISVGVKVENEFGYHEACGLNVTLDVEQKVAVLVSLLKVSRSLALFEGDIDSSQTSVLPRENHASKEELAVIQIKGFEVEIPVEWLAMALTHVDDSLRVDAAELLFLSPKTASLPSSLELNLMRIAVPLNMRCCSTAFQMKWASLFKKFFARVRTSLERQIKQGVWQPSDVWRNCKASVCHRSADITVSRAGELYQFMRWFSHFLFFSCYPSAPYERKIMAMELLIIMMSVWSIVPLPQPEHGSICSEDLYPYGEGLIRPDSTLLLVGSIIDSWDRLRENAFRILLSFPTPLPGISSDDMVQKLIIWGKKLVCSPRVRESDAGALTLRLIFRKYVVDLGWVVKASTQVTLHKSESELSNGEYRASKSKYPIIEYVNSLIDWLEAAVEEGEKDLLEACKNTFVHGVLLSLRYTFEELEWNSDIATSNISDMRCALRKLLELVMRITSLALWVVSADAWYLPRDTEDFDEDCILMEVQDDVGVDMQQHEAQCLKVPTEQIVMVGCWLAMKEVSLLLGTIIRKIPLPTSTISIGNGNSSAVNENANAINGTAGTASNNSFSPSDSVLDVNQLEVIGNHFLEVLLKMKHNGAIDKTRAGFTALCNRLLCSDDPRLCQLTESWMEQLMDRTVAKGQTVDDLLRRSAGIPAAFSAFFLSEPLGAPKKLLPRALRWLIDVASGSLLDQSEPCTIVGHLDNDVGNERMQISESNSNISDSKVRDEGVIPTVHAFNVLRAAFNDANLATDTSGFSAEAMIISIRSFSSPHWEIRNSACLAYTALVRRMVGFLNVHKRESARRAITSLEFFHRYPALHSFIFKQLKVATEMLLDGKSKSQLASIVHPSLCPVLILLSRLKPSPIASEKGDHLDPFLLMPFIQRCSMQRNMRVRVLASRSLTSLVSNENLRMVLLDIVSGLPCSKNETETGTDADISSSQCTNSVHVSYNAIHGILLQLSALLNANCRNLAEFASKDLILDDLIKALKECSWIGSPSCCPCPILNTSFLRVLDHMLSIAGSRRASKNYTVISSLLSELCSECLAVKSPSGTSFYDPTAFELRKQAAMSYFRCIYLFADHAEEVLPMPSLSSPADTHTHVEEPSVKNVSTDIEGRLISYMSDMSYEVRHATLKWLFRFVKTATVELGSGHKTSEVAAIISWAKANLQTTLMALLSVETHHKCVYYILRIIFAWNLLQFKKASSEISGDIIYIGGMDIESVIQFWDKLVSIHEISSHSKTLEALVCCLGLCIKRFSFLLRDILPSDSTLSPEELTQCEHLYGRIRHFVCVIKEYSDASQPVNLRKAAAEAVIASGLLEQAEFASSIMMNNGSIPSEDLHSHLLKPNDSIDMFANQILDIWFTCIKLLEDEDVSIRKELALDIQKCFPRHYRSRFHAGVVPSQVEKVIELSFEFLSSVFGHWDRYFDYLLRWVFDAASYAVPNGDLVRRVFDKEIDNYHEEKLLICQICCSHLETLQVSKIHQPEFHKLLREWREKFFNQLNSFGNNHVEKLEATDWIGGIGNHKDAFLPLYGNLLGLYALSKWFMKTGAENGAFLLSDIIQLGKSIRPFLKNPLVCNLYLLLVKLHEEMVGAASEFYSEVQEVGHIWDGFDPFFLLR